MPPRIGILLPRSTDYPSMGFDLLDGLRCRLKTDNLPDITVVPESIGFGEDRQLNYSKAEKLFLQDDVDILVAYLSAPAAEHLYPLMSTVNKPLIVLDAGMNNASTKPDANVIYISLHGIHSAYLAGKKAAEGGAEIIMATSFYDGGYRGPWAYSLGIEEAGGSVVNNYVGHYKETEFTVQPLLQALDQHKSSRVAACFSTYLSRLFMNRLNEENGNLREADYYCSSFMAEEQTMEGYALPKGNFYTFLSWSSALENEHNEQFKSVIQKEKKKLPNIFHLLGWEAGIIAAEIIRRADTGSISYSEALGNLENLQYDSPRGQVHIHPETRTGYSPLNFVKLVREEDGKCRLEMLESIPVTAEEHLKIMNSQPVGMTSGWLNNYLCT